MVRLARGFTRTSPWRRTVCAAAFVVLNSPYQESRYLLTITPFLLYFAYQALPALVGSWSCAAPCSTCAAAALPLLAVAGLVNINAQAMKHSTDYHRRYDLVVNGPYSPLSQGMFTAVAQLHPGRRRHPVLPGPGHDPLHRPAGVAGLPTWIRCFPGSTGTSWRRAAPTRRRRSATPRVRPED